MSVIVTKKSSALRRYTLLIAILLSSALASADQEYGPTQPGETLRKIAAKVRANKTIPINKLAKRILELNPNALINQRLRIGIMLRLPDDMVVLSQTPVPIPPPPPVVYNPKVDSQPPPAEIPEPKEQPRLNDSPAPTDSPPLPIVEVIPPVSLPQETNPPSPLSAQKENPPQPQLEPLSDSSAPSLPTPDALTSPAASGWIFAGVLVVLALGAAILLFLRKPRRPSGQDSASSVESEKIVELRARAEQESAAGNYNLARSILRNAISQYPADYQLRLHLLKVEHRQGDGPSFSADAEELKAVLHGQEPGLWDEVEQMGRALCPHLAPFCPPVEAKARREAVIALTPEYTVPELVQRAEQEASRENYNLARSALRQAIAMMPQEPDLRLLLLKIEHHQRDRASFAADAAELLALAGNLPVPIREELNRMQESLRK